MGQVFITKKRHRPQPQKRKPTRRKGVGVTVKDAKMRTLLASIMWAINLGDSGKDCTSMTAKADAGVEVVRRNGREWRPDF